MKDFYEPDEPVKDVLAAFEQGQKAVTTRWPVGFRCRHMSLTAGGVQTAHLQGWCGCWMEPVYAA